ncbi:maleylpyruvate isomerase family mycothiol-dependent enzyme [Pseudonocardia lutea]|uniref:Maleylpyruvate isomerase family mycothiol-dependent enzyme n=1 Tax=Pseudonocardia lutea TaxID=2172015 RepID=A0ABW1I9H0_9PSEU
MSRARTDLTPLARAEREDLADLLESLAPEQWEAPTLCERWRVREVAAHVVSYDDLGRGGFLRALARARFSGERANDACLAPFAELDPEDLVAAVRARTTPAGLTAGFGGRVALVDWIIHQQDLRRPLGLPRTVPAERLRPALDFARFAPPIRAFPRIRGLRLVADDLDWAAGKGPEVRGPGEALLLAMAGRRGVTGELTGPGVPTLAARIDG